MILLIKVKKSLFAFLLILLLGACSNQASIYEGIPSEGDGVIAVDIPDNNEVVESEPGHKVNELSETEKDLIEDLHESEEDKISFIVVDVENKQVMRSYLASQPRRLASISKLSTAIGALENVNNIEVPKVKKMLKNSDNGEASRYVRLAAKAINGTIAPGSAYTQSHSCPIAFLDDEIAAHTVLDWLMDSLSSVDWTDASINDGAGCHYDNFMNSIQVARIIEFSDSKGQSYDGLSFEKLLSISGTDGTWKNKNKDHKGRILAKTGTLNPNSNLAGFFYAKRGGDMKKYYFTVFVEKKGGGQYTTKARKLIESLMRYWINYYSMEKGEPISPF